MLNWRIILCIIGLGTFVVDSLAQDSLNVRRLFHWDDPSIPATSAYSNQYNEVWGYAAQGREYAIIGSTLGTHILDVTDPETSTVVDFVAGRFQGTDVVHRDYKTYAHHLYAVCDEGQSSLQVMDLSYLPDSVHVVYDSNELLRRAHNIQIDTVAGRMYTCGGSTPFAIYSLENPAVPTLLSDTEADVPWWSSTVGYVHDCFVRDNIVWCNDQDAMHVLDFTQADAPVLLGAMTSYPGQGYNHSGWLNEAGTLYAMADETHGSPLKFIDATDLGDLEVGSSVTSGVHPTSIIHNPFFTGDNVHVAYYYDGYWLWNTSDPQQPVLLGYYDTSTEPNADNYRGAWGVYPYLPSGRVLVSDMQTGLWVLDIDQATSVIIAEQTPSYRISPTLTNGPVRVTPISERGTTMHLEVLDASGKRIRASSQPNASMDIDLGPLSDGLYLIVVDNGISRYSQRIIKSSR
ncbi:MAG: choice-of-anchor B family protein [Flavobacteriales bacterium]|nr:choice-of-anchor B family protein [Flavobacteriales bacterium]